jgi:hypothetical protein
VADVTEKVLTPATSYNLMTLDEAKLLLGINPADNTQDALIAQMISIYSAEVSMLCDRRFGRERVQETWRDVYNGRLALRHWPVKQVDVESVVAAGNGVAVNAFELEERTGKLSYVAANDATCSSWPQSVIVTYTGGFNLPNDASMELQGLKQAVAVLIMDYKMRLVQSQVAGIRSVSHREARVMFFDPNAVLMRMAGKTAPSMQAVDRLLVPYRRLWA